MKYTLLLLKRRVEDVVMYPLILLGRWLAVRKPLPKEYNVFYFFPFFHTGGAEKVHALITKATGDKSCIIFFTRKSHNNSFLHLFKETGCAIKDVSRYTDNKWLYPIAIIFRGIIAGYINAQKKPPLVFNGQCNFGYKISPWIKKRSAQIELIHSISNFSYIRMPFLPFIQQTVMISTIKIKEHIAIYRQYGVPKEMDGRIRFIMNAIELPVNQNTTRRVKGFTVLYVGRGTPEKRVHLISKIARLLQPQAPEIVFEFLGDVQSAVPDVDKPYCKFWGNQTDEAVIDGIYNNASVLILLSDTEGFPMVVMEAMARGVAVVATAVGELPLHISNDQSGFLITNYLDEDAVVTQACSYLLKLYNNPALLHSISNQNRSYAYQHFGMRRFEQDYKTLFAAMKATAL